MSEAATIQDQLANTNVEELIQIVRSKRASIRITFNSSKGSGSIFFKNGRAIHAESGSAVGKIGLYELLKLPSGSFQVEKLPPNEAKTINQPIQSLLREAKALGMIDTRTATFRLDESNDPEALTEFLKDKHIPPPPPLSQIEKPKVQTEIPDIQIPADEYIEPDDAVLPADSEDATITSELDEAIIPADTPETAAEKREVSYTSPSVKQNVKPAAKTTPRTKVPLLETAIISEALERNIRQLMKYWDKKNTSLSADDLPLVNLPEHIQRQVQFRLEHSLQKLIDRHQNAIDLNNPQMGLAIKKMMDDLRSSWQITRDEFEEMLSFAVGFELAFAFDPARALTEFATANTDGSAYEITYMLENMIGHGIISKEYQQLVDFIEAQTIRRMHPRRLEHLIRGMLFRIPRKKAFKLLVDAVERMLAVVNMSEITDDEQHIQMELLTLILEGHGLPYEAGILPEVAGDNLHPTLKQTAELVGLSS
ncbi:DUF4388 domain-containing protein [Calditrichota bacterium]